MTLPIWADTLRPQQVTAIQEILRGFRTTNNQSGSIILLDAPTGSGKTLIGEMVRQQLDTRGLYLCSSLALQTQFARDFPEAAILKGRSNYPTADSASKFPSLTAADCIKERTTVPACIDCDVSDVDTRMHCKWCHPVSSCPYEQAKAHAIRSNLVCTNTYYYLYEANYIGTLTLNRGLVIVDEADTLETIILSFVTVQVSSKQAKEYNIEAPAKKTVESAWVDWAIEAAKILSTCLQSDKARGSSLEKIRYRKRTERLLENVRRLNNPDTGLQAGGWVYTGYDKGDIAFKPIRVDHLASDFLWRHCKRWLLMSATMISFQAMVDSLGITFQPEVVEVA